MYENTFKGMCCSDGDYDPDIFMLVLRCTCIKDKNTKFLVRCLIGFLLDCVECVSLEYRKRDENLYIIMAIAVYLLLIVRILWRYCNGKYVYKFNYILYFKCISFSVAFLIFYVTSDLDRETIKQLYVQFMEGEFKEIFLTVVNTGSLLDIALNVFSLIFLLLKFRNANKKGKDTYRKSFHKRFDLLGKSDFEDGSVEIPNQQNIFTVDIE